MTSRWLALTATLLLGALLTPSTAEAGGLFLTDRGTRPLGRGFAFVAGADDPQSLWYNPAGLSWSGQQLLLDGTMTFFYGSYTRIDSGGNVLTPVDIDAAPLPIPMLAYSHPIGDWTLGFGLHAPNATLLRWPYGVREGGGTCDATTAAGAADPTCRAAPQRYSLFSLNGSAFVNITPAVAWRRGGLSIGAGMHLLVGSFVGETAISGCDGTLCSQPEDPEWDGVARFTLSPIVHPGLTLGVTYDAGIVRIGGSFVWWPAAISGNAKLDVRLPGAPLFDGARVEGDRARLELSLPIILRLGVEVRPVRGLRVEAALVYERWSMQTAATIEPRDVWIRDAVAIGDYQVGPIQIPRNMNDVWSVRLGGSYAVWNDRMLISAGANYETSSFDDAHLTPLTLDSDKLVLGLGLSVEVKAGLWLDVSYAHVFMRDREVRNSQVPQPNPIRPDRNPGIPPTAGGTVYVGNGDYRMEADIVGLGLRWQIDAPSRAAPPDDEEDDRSPEPESTTAWPQAQAAPTLAPAEDEDGDGVPDVDDACPGDPPGTPVDALGCPLVTDPVPYPVPFRGSSLDLATAEPTLERMLSLLARHPTARFEVGAHTDGQGAASANLRLSTARARAVVQWLVARGVEASRLEARGYGETMPLTDNRTEESRAINRRVELRRLPD
ncbi:MAG: OmpA family protein [Myxococcales bacterium]|nr:OmpA family protein [Myxococcales bacterium]